MLSEQLKQIQRGYGWSQARMAKELGISRPLLSLVYSGKRNIHLKVVMGIVARFPALNEQVLQLLQNKNL